MRRALRLGLLAIPVAAGASSPWWAAPVGRRIDWFAAERVEVAGAHLLAPHEVLQASGVRVGTNVWSDPAPFVAALRRHPAIADAEVVRVLPRTLRIRVTEKMPAALVDAGTLRPATADGEVLSSVDPAREQIDLPLLDGRVKTDAAGRVTDAGTRAALAEAARLGELEPALMARVSELRPARGELRLVLGRPALEVLVRDGMDPGALVRLRAALDDVARRAAADTTHHGRPVVDARFDDQVVVRWQG
jgi:cell division protein FtsQ